MSDSRDSRPTDEPFGIRSEVNGTFRVPGHSLAPGDAIINAHARGDRKGCRLPDLGYPLSVDSREPTASDAECRCPIAEQSVPDGVRLILPSHGRRPRRDPGIVMLVLGNGLIVLAAVGGATLYHAHGGGGVPTWLLLIIIGLLGAVALLGISLIHLGMLCLFGRQSIELQRDMLIVVCRGGLFPLWRRIPLMRLKRLRIGPALDRDDMDMDEVYEWMETQATTHRFTLYAELDSLGSKPLLRWAELRELRQLAAALADGIARHYDRFGVDRSAPEVVLDPRVVEHADDELVTARQPADSDIEVRQERENELSIVVPRLSLLRATGGRSIGTVLLSTIGAAALGVFLFSGFLTGGGFSWFWLVFLIPAAFTWGGFLINRIGERETYIDVVNDTLLISRACILGVRQHQWRRREIESIQCGKSDLQINDAHLPQLEIKVATVALGGKVKSTRHAFLVGRSRQEIIWLAWRLRQALGIPINDDHIAHRR